MSREMMDLSWGDPRPFPPDEAIAAAIEAAKRRLEAVGHRVEVSVLEMKWWFAGPTAHPQWGLAEIIRVPWLVVHELVEIDEWKRNGGRIEGDPPDEEIECPEEHLRAAEVELELAAKEEDAEHLRARRGDIEAWLKDDLTPLPPKSRERCERLLAWTESALRGLGGPGG